MHALTVSFCLESCHTCIIPAPKDSSLVCRNRDMCMLVLPPDGISVSVQIIAVHADDPEFKGYDDISQLPKHRLAEIRRQALPHLHLMTMFGMQNARSCIK